MPDLNRSLLSESENADTLNGLGDVVITSPFQFQGLMYDGTNWVNSNIPNVYLVRNNTGSTLLKGTLVSASGAEPSGRIDVQPHQTTGTQDSEFRVMGIVTANIANGVNGEVMSFGTLTNVDTRGDVASALAVGDETWAAGDILYAHPTVAGKLTNVRPTHDLAVAFITVRHGSSGQIAIRIVPGNDHLEWMHDVVLTSPTSGDFLKYNGTVWINDTIDLGTDTAGNYVGSVAAGTGIDVSNTATEGGTFTVNLANTTVTAATYGNANTVGTFTVDAQGRLTNAVSTAISIASSQVSDFTEAAEDAAAGILTSATHSGLTASYDDANAKLTLDVDDFTITLGGDLTGNVTITNLANGTLNAAIAANSVELGTDTTGNYVGSVAAGTGISVTNTGVEGGAFTVTNNGVTSVSGTSNQIAVSGSTGAVTISLPANVTISNNLTVTGNFTVNGNTTTLNTANLNVEDNFVLLNSGVTGTPNLNAGIEIERGTSTNVMIRWNESTDKWEFTNDGIVYTEFGAGGGGEQTNTTINTNTVTTISSFDKDEANSAEFLVKVEQSDGFESSKVLLLHNGISTSFTQYGKLAFNRPSAVAGEIWSEKTSINLYENNDLIYDGQKFIRAGRGAGSYSEEGILQTSTDGSSWTYAGSIGQTFGISNISRINFKNSIYVANRNNQDIVYHSTDLITWVTVSTEIPASTIARIEYGDGSWIAGGYATWYAKSTDLITWTTQIADADFGGVGSLYPYYDNSKWLGIIGSKIYTSTDSITWVSQVSNFGGDQIKSVAYGNNLWVAVGYSGKIRTSTDTITWVTQTSNFGSTTIFSVAYGNNLWVAGGYNGQIRTSTDAITWVTRASTIDSDYLQTLAYGNDIFMSIAFNSGDVITSQNFASQAIPLTLSTDISGSDVRLRAIITDADMQTATVKVLKTLIKE
jgi:hypothetical protein